MKPVIKYKIKQEWVYPEKWILFNEPYIKETKEAYIDYE